MLFSIVFEGNYSRSGLVRKRSQTHDTTEIRKIVEISKNTKFRVRNDDFPDCDSVYDHLHHCTTGNSG